MDGTHRSARWAIVVFFCSLGMGYGVLMARIPALQEQIRASEGAVGMAVFSLGLGCLAGFALTPLLQRVCLSHTLLRISGLCFLCFLALSGLVWNPVSFCAAFALVGVAFGLAEMAANTQGILLERRLRGNYLSGLHAGYSIGGLGGSVLGALSSAAGYSPFPALCIVSLILFGGWIWAGRRLLVEKTGCGNDASEKTGQAWGRIPGIVFVCGILALAAFSVEGSCGEWSALLLYTVKGAAESTAALGFGAFSIAIAASRLLGDALRRRWGDFALLAGGALLALCGQAVVLLAPWPLVCLCGYALTGAGIAPMMPTLLSRAGNRADISPQRATTIISAMGYSGLLVIPPSIGWLAEFFGLRAALLLPVCFTCLLVICSPLFRAAPSASLARGDEPAN